MRYILFDLYGLFHHAQTPHDFEVLAETVGTTAAPLRSCYFGAHRADYDAGVVNSEQYWALIAEDLGIEIDWRVGLAADIASWDGVNEEMLVLARELHSLGVRIALLSNEPKEMSIRTRALRDWLTLFDPVVFSGEVGLAKPHPAMFELALERMRAVAGEDLEPRDVLFTDDTLGNVETARELGFATHHFEGAAGLREVLVARGLLPDPEA